MVGLDRRQGRIGKPLLDPMNEESGIDWLGKHVWQRQMVSGERDLQALVGGEKNNGNRRQPGVVTQRGKKLDTVHMGHVDVGQNEIRGQILEQPEGVQAVIGRPNDEITQLQRLGDGLAHFSVVIHQQNESTFRPSRHDDIILQQHSRNAYGSLVMERESGSYQSASIQIPGEYFSWAMPMSEKITTACRR